MPLTTKGLIDEMRCFRSDKLALVALLGSMGRESEADALERLREIIHIAEERLTEIRRVKRAERGRDAEVWRGVLDLATEVEPWLAQVVALAD